MWPPVAFAAGVASGVVSLLFFTSPAKPRVVVVNETSVRIRFPYCTNTASPPGAKKGAATLEPGEAADSSWGSPSATLPVGVATTPGDRLFGRLSDPAQGQETSATHVVLAPSAQPCPRQAQGSSPKGTVDDDDP